ncbi:hypothetical protein [Paraglaciecola sp.]|uniref:hypothetical protein n=1 Tax=Paraglaciecola sp. TaxID=1920173 RepID=UPI003EF3DE8A
MSKHSYPKWIPLKFIDNLDFQIKAWNLQLGDYDLPNDKYCNDILRKMQSHPDHFAVRQIQERFCNHNDLNAKTFWCEFNFVNKLSMYSLVGAMVKGLSSKKYKTELMPRDERQKFKNRISATSEKLQELVADSPFEHALVLKMANLANSIISNLQSHGVAITKAVEDDIYSNCFSGVTVKTVLKELSQAEEQQVLARIGQTPVILKKPNDKDSNRAHFAQTMTNYFGDKTGEAQQEAVRVLCLIFYPHLQEFSDPDLKRIAPWPPKL